MNLRNFIIVMTLLVLSACSRGATIATVDGEKISAGDLVEKMRMQKELYDSALLSDGENFASFRRQALESLIQETILIREAERLGISPDEEADATPKALFGSPDHFDPDDLEDRGIDPKAWQRAQRRRATIKKLIMDQVMEKIPVTDEEIEAYYRKHISDFRENTRFHARQILVDKKEIADRIYVRLMNGEEFAKIAKENSVSPDAARGGDLGFFDADSYPEVFAEVCQQLKPGEISNVTATPYGYQIFQLIEKRPPRQRKLEEVADGIRRMIRESRLDEVFLPWFEGLMKRAEVSVKEEKLKEVRLNG